MKNNDNRVGIASDHGGFELKKMLISKLIDYGYNVVDFGATEFDPEDDYPDYVIPLAVSVAKGNLKKGIAVCGSGVGACVAANKVPGIRAALITDPFSAHQGVEDDNMNILCLGGRVTGNLLALELIKIYLNSEFKGLERFKRRLDKISALESENNRIDYLLINSILMKS